MNTNTIQVIIETKSNAGQTAIYSILDDDALSQQLADRITATVEQFINETGVMGTKPFGVSVATAEFGIMKLMRDRLKEAKEKRQGLQEKAS